MEKLVEANDILLEQVSMLLDEENKSLKRKNPDEEIFKPLPIKTPDTVVSSWNRKNKHGASKTFKLFHATNIVRPQLQFKDKIDNSSVPFIPKLTTKPNALKELPKALLDMRNNKEQSDGSLAIANLVRQGRNYSEDDAKIYDHPYQLELDNWKPSESQLQRVQPQNYKKFPDMPCNLISDPDDLSNIIEKLKKCTEIAVDLEHHSYRSFQGITCLIQISTREEDFLIDTLVLRKELEQLNEVFTNPNIVKVFHGSDHDVMWLQRDFGVYVINMFDTGQASRELNFPRFSFDYLLKKYVGVNADKKYQLADWRIRPLPEEMRKYAQEDTHYLLYLYDILRNELLGNENEIDNTKLNNVWENSKKICLRKYEKQLFREDNYLKFYERYKKKNLNPTQIELLRLLYNWRDCIARQDDESTGYVLPNHMMFQIADILPREAHGVLACCNPVPPLVRQNVQNIHQMIIEAKTKMFQVKGGDQSDTKNIPKVVTSVVSSYEDVLRCPHDLTHVTAEIGHFDPPKITENSFKAKQIDLEKIKLPNEKKIEEIYNKLPEPFYKFMPDCKLPLNKIDEEEIPVKTAVTFSDFLKPDFVWKLKAPDKKPSKRVKEATIKQEWKKEPEIVLKPNNNGQKKTKLKHKTPEEQNFESYNYNSKSYERFNKPPSKKRYKKF